MHLTPEILNLVREFIFKVRTEGLEYRPDPFAEQLSKSSGLEISPHQVETAVETLRRSGQIISRKVGTKQVLYWLKGRKRSEVPDEIIRYLEKVGGRATISLVGLARELDHNQLSVKKWLDYLIEAKVIRVDPSGRTNTYYLEEEEVEVQKGTVASEEEKKIPSKRVSLTDVRHRVILELKGMKITIEPM